MGKRLLSNTLLALFGAAGLVAGNYAFQMHQPVPDWHAALERSFFQVYAALFTAVFLTLFTKVGETN